MKKATVFTKVLSVLLVVSLVMSLAVPGLAAQTGVSFEKVDNDRVSAKLPGRDAVELQENEDAYADTDIVRVSIFLDRDGALDAGYNAKTAGTNFFTKLYRNSLKKDQDKLVSKIEKATGSELDVVWNLTLAANLISANVAYGDIETIEALAGVRTVVIETEYQPDVVSSGAANPNMATSGEQTGTTPAWMAGYTGAGTRVAIIDTGIDLLHEAFDAAAYEFALASNASKLGMDLDAYLESLDLLDAEEIASVLDQLNVKNYLNASAEDLYFNSKVPFGFSYIDADLDLSHYNSEHGSHVAGIAGANAYVADGDGFTSALTSTFVQGVAPDAQLLVMKVFGENGGAYEADYLVAIEDAILLGADSVNLSLGSGNPGMTRNSTAEYQAILDSLDECGVVVVMSAGNSGSWVDQADNAGLLYADDVSMHTGGSPGTFTNSFGVASVNNAGFTALYVSVGGNIVGYTESATYGNKPMATIAGEHEYVFLNDIGTEEQFAALGADLLKDKVVMCYRGTTSFFEKANAAVALGAKAVIIVNNQSGIIGLNLTGYSYSAPVVSIQQNDGEFFKENGTVVNAEDGTAWYWTGKLDISDSMGAGSYNQTYYTMSSFSSWGVPGTLTIKPEITAPGGDIYSVAGNVPGLISGHDQYELMSGTSMAAPQVAGMSALMAQYIQENGLEALTGLTARQLAQSLLMSTAVPMQADAYSYYSVLQQGAGLANVGAAIMADTYILMNEDATVSYADGKVKAELGDDPNKTGKYSFSFTINNLENAEKLYSLYADIFMQSPVSDGKNIYMDTTTWTLGALTSFTVDGKAITPTWSIDGMDFNGDGAVNTLDGQTLLDYATGLVTELTNADKADIDEDGDIDSYDAYLFLSVANASVAVPANGSVEVKVEIIIPAEYKELINAYYPNGTYIQGYVFAEGVATEEGVAGTTHSIPVLAYYGNWSDPSMYDKGSVMDYMYGTETRIPYLYSNTLYAGYSNGLLYTDEAGDEYWFGGNPLIDDGVYLPERNAVSPNAGYHLSMLGFTTIRNAAAAYFQMWNSETGEFYTNQDVTGGDPLGSAYYHVNLGAWKDVYWQLNLSLDMDEIPNNTPINVGITSVLEYYVDENGNVDWDALGKGATFSVPMVVDSEAPVLKNVEIAGDKLAVTAADNQYIAAVALYDIYGQYLYTYTGADLEQKAGDTVDFALDLSQVNGPSFLLQVYDYAQNVTTYEIKTQIGEVTDEITGVKISKTATVMQKGNTEQLTAAVYPVNAVSRDIVWTSSDESVVTVDANGKMTAVAEGMATVTATAAADASYSASCRVEVIDINLDLNAIVWDEEGSIWFSEFNTTTLPDYTKLSGDMLENDYMVAATMSTDGTLYASSLNTNTGVGSIYKVDPVTYEVTWLNYCNIYGEKIFFSDLTYAPGMFGTGCLLGTYGPYLIAIDPETGDGIALVDEFEEYLVGVASCYYDPYMGNCLYLIQNDGTVIQEVYIDGSLVGYDGYILPYYYLFYGFRATMDTGYDVGNTYYFNSAYYDSENAILFWSAFNYAADDSDVELLAIDADYTGNVYSLGTFAPTVWPVGGLYEANDYDYDYTYSSGLTEEEIMVLRENFTKEEIQLVKVEAPVQELTEIVLPKVELNAAKEPVTLQPMGGQSGVTVNEEYATVLVYAGPDGDLTMHSNGVFTVTWDPTALKLTSYKSFADYYSFNVSEGSVTFGFVSMEGIYNISTAAYLYFDVLTTDAESVTVTYTEVDDKHVNVEETIAIEYPHTNTEVKDAKDATCTEDGYTGDTYCTDCGMLIAEGEVIPANGHGETEVKDAKDATCTEDGYTGDTYCTECGEKVAAGEVIPAHGHNYESVVTKPTVDAEGYTTHTCTDCGDSYVDSYTPKVDPENPKTVENARNILAASLLVMSAAAAAICVGSRKKKF